MSKLVLYGTINTPSCGWNMYWVASDTHKITLTIQGADIIDTKTEKLLGVMKDGEYIS